LIKILIVEDNEMDRILVAHLLSDHYDIVCASDGVEGLEICETESPDVVVTDLVMPRLDGMQMLTALHARHPEIPVIMMTSEGSESTATQAMDLGAASYVPKHQLPERLSETVDQVVELLRADRDYSRLLQRMTYCRYTFVLENDLSLIEPLVEFIQQIAFAEGFCDYGGRNRIGVALHEALFNAMYHGNLQLPSELNQTVRTLLREGKSVPIVEERRKNARYEERRVMVDLKATSEQLRIVINDEGEGFDHQRYGRHAGDSVDPHRHRGILLIESIIHKVIFNELGNKLTLILHRDSSSIKSGLSQSAQAS
jgi:CheY-like chemotaxis protein